MTQTAKPRHHFIRDVNHIVAPTDLQTACVITRRRNDDSSRGQNRLCDKRPHLVRPHLENLVLEFLHQEILEAVYIHPLRPSIRVRRGNEMHGIQSGIEPVLVAGLP